MWVDGGEVLPQMYLRACADTCTKSFFQHCRRFPPPKAPPNIQTPYPKHHRTLRIPHTHHPTPSRPIPASTTQSAPERPRPTQRPRNPKPSPYPDQPSSLPRDDARPDPQSTNPAKSQTKQPALPPRPIIHTWTGRPPTHLPPFSRLHRAAFPLT